MMAPRGTSTNDIDLPVRLAGDALLKLAALSVAEGKPVDALVIEALKRALALRPGMPASRISRNQREGYYLGHARGHHVRGQIVLPGHVRSRQARRVLTRRILIRAGKHVARLTMAAQAARAL
jgi:hypothetical protein